MRRAWWFGLVNALVGPGAVLWTSAQASEMGNEELRAALARGALPSIVIDFAKCQDDKGKQGPPVAAVVRFFAYNLLDDYIATSGTHLFEATDGSMKLEYIRARFKPDDSVELTLRRIDPATYKPASPEQRYLCNRRDGAVQLKGD
ncbi:VirK family protein [Chelatococcus asaccharovorans]|uniref:VirK protein n=1 Tax=Chelatococcus asaccharovorans TaxID=28210 RepID=A0A2V3UDR7_9HYPH|nr:VirK family protein [Chelatococcus asaccharovorans]MBS7706980.1 hypothetical protein [Chelatococcus asaccharovorans]PXW63160.1 VirK protein [Chelatococcus asaccharovorans]CAH1653578.1 VirK protein [Chelatococcus asaccharovorans]CAH1694202.1 VirK protein [Chelatococcus asaccharovorans]